MQSGRLRWFSSVKVKLCSLSAAVRVSSVRFQTGRDISQAVKINSRGICSVTSTELHELPPPQVAPQKQCLLFKLHHHRSPRATANCVVRVMRRKQREIDGPRLRNQSSPQDPSRNHDRCTMRQRMVPRHGFQCGVVCANVP